MNLDVGTFESRGDYKRQRQWRMVFNEAVRGYRDALAASPLVAASYDEDVRPRRLGAELIHFKIDIEHATEKALQGRPDLLAVWHRIVHEDESIPANLYARVALRCGRIYLARKLTPYEYFTVIRHGHADRATATNSEIAA